MDMKSLKDSVNLLKKQPKGQQLKKIETLNKAFEIHTKEEQKK